MGIFMGAGHYYRRGRTLLGAIGGVLLAHNVEAIVHFLEGLFGIRFLAADVYYISDLPSRIEWLTWPPSPSRRCS